MNDINPNQNYQRLSAPWVHTGQQIINLLKLAKAEKPIMQIIILLDIEPTDKPAGNPDDKYGVMPVEEVGE